MRSPHGWHVAIPALLWLSGCSSSEFEPPAPDPVVVAAARAERERVRAELQVRAEKQAELERAVQAIESEGAEDPLSEGEVYQVLAYYCGECHTRPMRDLSATDGFWDIDSVERMILIGKVTPGDGEGSRLVRRVRSGEMPPPPPRYGPPLEYPRMLDVTLDRIVDFIDALPNPSPPE